jgi:hypothetical protein
MTLYRALTVGLLGAGVWLLARPIRMPRPTPTHSTPTARPPLAMPATTDPLRVIDVKRGTGELLSFVKLQPGERVTAIDDIAMTEHMDPIEIAQAIDHAAGLRDYIDLSIDDLTAHTSRRVLLLLH